jgi:hypothetical protein
MAKVEIQLDCECVERKNPAIPISKGRSRLGAANDMADGPHVCMRFADKSLWFRYAKIDFDSQPPVLSYQSGTATV